MRRRAMLLALIPALGGLMLHFGTASSSHGPDGPDLSTLVTEHTAAAPGESVAVIHQRPVNYLTSNGELAPIDRSWRQTESGFVNETNTLKSRFGHSFGDGWDVALEGGSVHFEAVAMGLRASDGFDEFARPDAGATPRLGGTSESLLFDETYPGVGEEFIVERGGLEHIQLLASHALLAKGEGDLAFVYKMTVQEGIGVVLHPLTVSEADGEGVISMPYLELVDAHGRSLAIVPAPHVWDSGEPTKAAVGGLDWEPASSRAGFLTVSIANGILEQMRFPVMIDPAIQQTLSIVNTNSGAAWGHFELDPVTYVVRYNGSASYIGGVLSDFGPPIGIQLVRDVVATPVFDISGIPGKIKKASIGYQVLADTYAGGERVEINDHKTDAFTDVFAFEWFAANLADGRNSAPFLEATPDHSMDATYIEADEEDDEEADILSDLNSYRLKGRAVKDMNDSLKGKIRTVSEFPLPAGLFTVAFHDTSSFNESYWLWLYNLKLTVEYDSKNDEDPDLP